MYTESTNTIINDTSIRREPIAIGISSCLLGYRVRYDGGHKFNPTTTNTLLKKFHLIPFCPEVSCDLGIPREPLRLVLKKDGIHCISENETIGDVTELIERCCDTQRSWLETISGYIFKSRSPSCGPSGVTVFQNTKPSTTAPGIYAQQIRLHFPNLPLIDENDLENQTLRGAFIHDVLAYNQA